jgi:hypothetical protein
MEGTERWICRHCNEVHAKGLERDLHIGRLHADVMDAEEAAAFTAGLEFEDAWFKRFRKHVYSAFATIPVIAIYVLSVALLIEMSGNPAYPIMMLPGVVMFSVLLYAMMFSRLSLKEQETAETTPKV